MLFAPGAFITTMPRCDRGVEVHVVHAGTRAGDDAQHRRGGDHVSGHLGGAPHDQRVRISKRGQQVWQRPARLGVHGPLGLIAK